MKNKKCAWRANLSLHQFGLPDDLKSTKITLRNSKYRKAMKDSIWNKNPAKFLKECKRLRSLALRIIDGTEPTIEGSRKMLAYRFWMKEGNNKAWDIFRVVCAKSDHLPIGAPRQYWDKEALKKKDEEIKEVEEFYRNAVIDAARRIRDEYSAYLEQGTAADDNDPRK